MKMNWNETGFWAEIIAMRPRRVEACRALHESCEWAALWSYGTFEEGGFSTLLELDGMLRT
jgi:hypothetical protein